MVTAPAYKLGNEKLIKVLPNAANRLTGLLKKQGRADHGALRIAVVGGGCSGLQYKMDLVDGPANRDIMVVSDEDVVRLEGCPPYPAAFLWIVDITDEKHPTVISTFQLDDMPPEEQPYMTGCHQPSEQVRMGTEIPVAWFAHGLHIVDIAKPHASKEVA